MGKQTLRYKYNRIAIALAVTLLLFLSLVSACSAEEKKPAPAPAAKTEPSEPEVKEEPTIAPFKAEGLEKNIKYFNVRNNYQLETGDLILVNAACRYRGQPAELVGNYSYLFNDENQRIGSTSSTMNRGCKRMLEAFNDMLCAFYDKTKLTTIMLADIYLNEAEQKNCYEHDTGLAFDLRLYLESEKSFPLFTGEGEYGWFAQNCHNYGFILRYPDNKQQYTGVSYRPEHFRFVGRPHSQIIHDKAMCLEEYLDYIKSYTLETPLSYRDRSGNCWAVYYYEQKIGEDSTNIPIPLDSSDAEYPYTISGDNRNGFIIAVDLTPKKTDTDK